MTNTEQEKCNAEPATDFGFNVSACQRPAGHTFHHIGHTDDGTEVCFG